MELTLNVLGADAVEGSELTSEVPGADAGSVVLLGAEWQPRAMLRAQLIEEGFDVVATDTWPMMRRHLRPGSKPRLAIVDLKGLPNPDQVLNDLSVLMNPHRVLVLSAIGTIPAADIARLGFRVLPRPLVIERVVDVAARMIRSEAGKPVP